MARVHGPVRALWVSARPKTLLLSFSPIVLAWALTPSPLEIDLVVLALLLLCTLFMQMAANLANDYYDVRHGVDRERVGPLRGLQLGRLSSEQVKMAFVVCFALALILGGLLSWLRGGELFILGVGCLLAAYLYTAGPFPLSHWMLGEAVAWVFFGPVAVLGSLWALQGHFSLLDIFLSLLPGLMAALMMGLNNQRDARTDQRAQKRTLSSVWGEGAGRVCNIFFLAMTVVLPFLYREVFDLSSWVILPLIAFFPFVDQWRRLLWGAREKELIGVLEATGKYSLLYHLLLAVGLNL